MCRIPTVTLICVLACAATLRAQDTIRPLPIKARAAVFVLDDTGVEHRGRFVRADDHDMVILVNGDERRFKRDTIVRIDRQGDSLKNGAIIGVLIGAPIGVVGSLFTGNIGPFLASTLGWMSIGIGLDAAHRGRTPVYTGVTKTTLQTSEGRGGSVQFTVRW